MKRVILITMMLCGTELLYAQNSSTYSYPNTTSQKVVLRTDPAGGGEIVYCTNSIGIAPNFFYRDASGVANRIFVPAPYNGPIYVGPNLVSIIEVEDMAIGSTFCYFCGSIHTYTASVIAEPQDNREDYIDRWDGFVGKFLLSEITTASNPVLNAKYVLIPNTVSIERLKIEPSSGGLAAIARGINGSQGFVLLDDLGTTIMHQLLFSQDVDENITDLAFTTNSLVTVSGFNTNRNKIALRNGNLATIFDISNPTHLSYFDTRYDFNTGVLNTVVVPRPSSPTEEVTRDIRATEIPSTEKIIVAYEGSGGGFDQTCMSDHLNTNIYGFSLYVTNPAFPVHPIMNTAQIASRATQYEGGLLGVKYLQRDETSNNELYE